MPSRARGLARRVLSRFGRALVGDVVGNLRPRLKKVDRRLGRLDEKLDVTHQQLVDDGLLLRRVEMVVRRLAVSADAEPAGEPAPVASPLPAPAVPVTDDWWTLEACPVCGHGRATLVCEYNRFVVHRQEPDASSAVYNYSLCHRCGVVYAARRPVRNRFRDLLARFGENLGRTDLTNVLLSPGALTAEAKLVVRRRLEHGVFVSEHAAVRRRDWVSGAFRDRMAAGAHVELLGSLLSLHEARVLEIRTRTGAISAALKRLYECDAATLPMFEGQQYVIRSLYDLPAEALIDFERFSIPYDGPFDLVVSNHMLTHAVRPDDFLRTIAAHLPVGGHLYLYNEPDEVEFLEQNQSMFNVLNPFHLQTFDRNALVTALAIQGFETLFVSHTGLNFLCLARRSENAGMVEEARPALELRLGRYRRARDLAILSLPQESRAPFQSEWPMVVERAVLAGDATLDQRGRVVFGRRLARSVTPTSH